ncbi:MAG: heavy metal transporter [Papillibacter sp.]|jgi:sulfite exporter TauE/SafE/copper chaperone CopZ|nr:heavy metal transporter [Papillibacter sp.]
MANRKRETFKVSGMSCTHCEAAIEKALLSMNGIYDVRASFSKNQVTIAYDPELINFKRLRSVLKGCGYTLEEGEPKKEKTTADYTADNNRKGKSLTPIQFVGIIVILIALYAIINSTLGFNFLPEIKSSMGYGVLFLVGLLTSLHCVAMCGGINLSQCVNAGAEGGNDAKLKPSLLYNLGRVTSYTIIGGIVGAIGAAVSFSGWARGLVAIVSGLFMIIMGLSMTGLFPWINKITPRLPRFLRERAGTAGRGRGPYIIGLLNGLMPCGPLQAMQLYALGTGSFVAGAASMFFFSLGTVPLMFGLGAVVTILGSKFTKKMMKVSAVLVAVLGVVMLSRGLVLSGVTIPVFSTQKAQTEDVYQVKMKDNIQYITSQLQPGSYPVITVQRGLPVVWSIKADKNNINGCNRTVVIPKYNIEMTFKPGDNIIKFTPDESGNIRYSCWMGMIKGQIRVVDDLDSKSAQAASDESAANIAVLSADSGESSDSLLFGVALSGGCCG